MLPEPLFLAQPKSFWAYVRTIGQALGYSANGQIRVFSVEQIADGLAALDLSRAPVIDDQGEATDLGRLIVDYIKYRAELLNNVVEPLLMDADEAGQLFEQTRTALQPECPLPMNKQKGDKKAPAFLTGLVNMSIWANAEGRPCDYDPRLLTTVTRDGLAIRTLARRVDGAYPATVNPVAIWEIKEYYYTTTFGSRVADGVYETLLDGMELEDLREHEGIDIKHYLVVDSHFTWWECGKSYLCRLIDMLHMGYVDEILFGREVVTRVPELVRGWNQAL